MEWINVKDNLPAYGTYNLVLFETAVGIKMQCVAYFINQSMHAFQPKRFIEKWYVYPAAGHTIEPTHWMSLPNKP